MFDSLFYVFLFRCLSSFIRTVLPVSFLQSCFEFNSGKFQLQMCLQMSPVSSQFPSFAQFLDKIFFLSWLFFNFHILWSLRCGGLYINLDILCPLCYVFLYGLHWFPCIVTYCRPCVLSSDGPIFGHCGLFRGWGYVSALAIA